MLRLFGWLRWFSSFMSRFRAARGGSALAILTVLFSVVTVVLMSRSAIVNDAEYMENLRVLYCTLRGTPTEPVPYAGTFFSCPD